MTNCERLSLMTSSDKVGRCEISMVFFYLLLGIRYLMPPYFLVSTRCARLRRACDRHGFLVAACAAPELLRVVLDDQLLGERHLDLGALGQLVDQDALLLADHLNPAGDRTVAGGLPGDLE